MAGKLSSSIWELFGDRGRCSKKPTMRQEAAAAYFFARPDALGTRGVVPMVMKMGRNDSGWMRVQAVMRLGLWSMRASLKSWHGKQLIKQG
jgi:hypothetical protein